MGKNTQTFVSPVNARAQISALLSTHVFDQVKSDLVKETNISKPKGLPLKTGRLARQSGRRGERNRGENSRRNSPEHPREPQSPLGRAGGCLIGGWSGTRLVGENAATSRTSPEVGRAHELWLLSHTGRRKTKLFLFKAQPRQSQSLHSCMNTCHLCLRGGSSGCEEL